MIQCGVGIECYECILKRSLRHSSSIHLQTCEACSKLVSACIRQLTTPWNTFSPWFLFFLANYCLSLSVSVLNGGDPYNPCHLCLISVSSTQQQLAGLCSAKWLRWWPSWMSIDRTSRAFWFKFCRKTQGRDQLVCVPTLITFWFNIFAYDEGSFPQRDGKKRCPFPSCVSPCVFVENCVHCIQKRQHASLAYSSHK